jgi:hypothetical protein
MSALITVLAAAGLIIVANVLVKANEDQYLVLFDWLLLFINLAFLLLGAIFVIIPAGFFSSLPDGGFSGPDNPRAFGATIAMMAIWGILASIRPLRRATSRWLPLNPSSPVHSLALVLSGYLMGSTVLTLTQGGLEVLAATAVPADIGDILAQFLIFALLSLLGVGLLTRREGKALCKRLGIERPTTPQMLSGVRWIILLVILQWVFGGPSAC